ncbi:S9 family peptidase [bacterium]|nr:S9 family peptidase [bacterium]
MIKTGERINLPHRSARRTPGWRWSPDGRSILVAQTHEGRVQLYLYTLETASLSRIKHPAGVVDDAWFRPDGKLWINRSDAATRNQVLEIDPGTGESRVLLGSENVPPGTRLESVSFTGARGDRIQGYLGLPPGKPPFPAVLHVHGGPASQVMDRWMPLLQAWIDAGFALLSLNYHGSTGFGREFEDCIKGDLMNLELADYAAARQYLVERGIADPDKVVITGASYGGFSTLSALTRQPELWACGVGSIVIGDLALMYEDASAPLQGWCLVYTGGRPEEKPEIYRERSPITHVAHMRAPLLILQGKNDSRTPARQCEKFVEAARAAGKDVTLVWFEEGHGTLGIEQAIENARRSVEFARRAVGLAAAGQS